MPKCGACGRFIAAAGAAQCSECPGLYHRPCVAIPDNIIVSRAWRCPECTKNTPKGNNAATPVKGLEACNHSMSCGKSELTCGSISEDHVIETGERGSYEEVDERPSVPSLDDTAHNASQLFQVEFGLEVRFFREELRGLREEIRSEFRDLRRELVDIRTGLAACNCRADNIESRLQTLEQQIHSKGSPEVSVLEQTVESLKLQINEREQDVLLADIEISNLPEVRGENVTHTVVTLAAKLGVSLEDRDIVYAERVGAIRAEGEATAAAARGRRVVLRLARRQLRDDLLRGARVRRGATSEGLGLDGPARRFYVNERLTRSTRHLFYMAREAARSTQWKYAWTRNGRIYVRQADGKPARLIRSEKDLAEVFCADSV